MIKNILKRREESDTYQTRVCRLSGGDRSQWKWIYKELSVNTVAFFSCRGRLTKVLAVATRRQTGSKGWGGWVRLSDVDTRELVGFQNKLLCHFILEVDMFGGRIQKFVIDKDRPVFLGRKLVGLVVDGVLVSKSSWPFKWNGAHLHILRASDPFVHCKMHYIFYTGVGTQSWMICNRQVWWWDK